MVAVQTVYQEIETLSPKQLQSVYSYVCRLKHPQQPVPEIIEPFANEQEALDWIDNVVSEWWDDETI